MADETFIEMLEKEKDHADLVWEKKGLVKSPASRSSDRHNDTERYALAYQGQQWGENWLGLDEDEFAVTPSFFSAANTFQAQLLARTPEAQVLPRRPDPETAEAARVVEALINYDIEELKLKRQWNACVRDAFFTPAGILRHGFTPYAEYETEGAKRTKRLDSYAGIRPDKPWMRRIQLRDFRCTPTAETLHSDGDAWWCAFRSLLTLDQIKKNPSMVSRRDLQATVSLEVRDHKGELLRRSPQDFVEVWTYYENRERTWFQLAEGAEQPIRERDDWPLPWEDLPYDACFFNPQVNDLFPEPYAHALWPSVVERNKIRTLMLELVKRMRKLVIVNESVLGEGQADALDISDLTEIIRVDGDVEKAFAEVSLGGFDSSLLPLDSLIQQDIRETLGQSLMDRGQRINVESGTEAAGVLQGSNVAATRNQESVEEFLGSSIRHYAQARQATMQEDELVPIVGRKDAQILQQQAPQGPQAGPSNYPGFFNVTPDQINAELDFTVRAGSSLPDTRERRTQEALAVLQVAGQFPQIINMQEVVANFFRAQGLDVSRFMLSAEQLQATQGQPGQEGQEAAPGQDQSQLIGALNDMGSAGGLQ